VQPPDNDFSKARFSKQLLDPKLKLTDEERRRLQDEIDQLFALEKYIDYLPDYGAY
jgi:hypothetical protein